MFIIGKDGMFEVRLGDGKTGLVTGLSVTPEGKKLPSLAFYHLGEKQKPGTDINRETLEKAGKPVMVITFTNPKSLAAMLAAVAHAGLKFKAKKKVVKKLKKTKKKVSKKTGRKE